MLTAEQILAAHKANVETLFGLTNKAFEGVEKLVELNVTASKTALNEAAGTAQSIMSVLMPTLPVNANGKVDRGALLGLAAAADRGDARRLRERHAVRRAAGI